MFIIKYMAGLVEKPENDGASEDDYDPHQHRVIKNPTSYSDTMIHYLKGSVGAGVLAMPHATYRMGVIGTIAGLVVIGFFAAGCIQILIAAQYKLCKRWKRGYMAYPKSMRLALQDGPKCMRCFKGVAYYFVIATLMFWQLGICTIYFVFVADNIKQVLDIHDIKFPVRLHLCYLLVPQIISCLVKDLKLMTPISSTSVFLTLVGLILVFYYLIEDDLELSPEMLKLKDPMEIPAFIGTCLFALEAVGVVLALEYNMERPKRFVGLCGLFNIGMVLIISLYLMVGIFGYLKYSDKILASITLNLPTEQKKAQAAKIIFALAIFLTFPLQNFVAYEILWAKLQKRVAENRRCFPDYFLRIFLVILPWCCAVAVPKLGTIISVIGAFSLSLLAMVFPAMMDIAIYHIEPEGYGFCKCRLIRDILIIIIGTLIMVSGTYAGVMDVIKSGTGDGA